ncbi:MAG: hypothetical protein WCG52_10690, partial [bacterium]
MNTTPRRLMLGFVALLVSPLMGLCAFGAAEVVSDPIQIPLSESPTDSGSRAGTMGCSYDDLK